MLKRICLLLMCLVLWPSAAMAADELPAFETMSVFAAGNNLGEASPGRALPAVGYLAQRVGFPKLTTFSLEASALIPSGFGANLLIDAIHHPDFRLHLLDPGVHFNVFSPMREINIKRSWDLSFGLGFSLRVTDAAWLTADYRMFIPDPIRVVKNYGSLIRETVNNLATEGTLCLGLGITY